jgi:hypothetical protein
VLSRGQTETAETPYRTRFDIIDRGPVRLSTILNHDKIMLLYDTHDGIHIRWASPEMYYNDTMGSRGNSSL